MCGLAGIVRIKKREIIEEDILKSMLKKIRHRGPDGMNILNLGNVLLGFVRLSFIDLEGGMQPISNEDDSITMICNGEIFNYEEIRDDLVKRGHVFKTKTDVEVILHLYEEHGESFVDLLNGQFAIVLYDSIKHKTILVRDHIGIAPLFYTIINGAVVFASEIKAILEYPNVPRKINLRAVDQLLNFPGVIAPLTFFEGIHALEPGHILEIDSTGSISNKEYWDVCYKVDSDDLGEDYYVNELRELIVDSINKRLIADVPIGFYVSGGLDSSIVACFINKFISTRHMSFSAEVQSDNFNENSYQKLISETIDSEHFSVKITDEELWKYMKDVVYYSECGLRESYDVAAFKLSELVGKSPTKAVLTGQGADEFFNGYVGYISDAFRMMQKDKMSKEEKEVNQRLWGDPYFRYERNHFETGQTNFKMYSDNVRTEYPRFSTLSESPINLDKVKGLSTQRRRSYIDIKTRLSDHLLGDHGDRMFFSHSVEGRHPFLDKRVMEFAINIPEKYKLKGTNEKYILKKIAEGTVPNEIIKRKKYAFATPGMTHMLKDKASNYNNLKYIEEDVIREQGVFDVNSVNEMRLKYEQKDFNILGSYQLDYLQVVMTVSMLIDTYKLSL